MRLRQRWPLISAVGGTLLLQLWLCYFFAAGDVIPLTNDVTPANYRFQRFQFPPQGFVNYDYWLGFANPAMPLTPTSLFANLSVWLFFTVYYPLCGALAVATAYWLLRELKLGAAAALVGGLIYGWQGPLLSNIYSGHFGPMMLLVLMPLAFGAALRAIRDRSWWAASGCGVILGMNICLQPDQGMLVSLLVGALYLAAIGRRFRSARRESLWLGGRLLVAIALAVLVALPTLQTMLQTQITGVKQVASDDPRAHWNWATQWSLPFAETLDYLVPGFFGWRSGNADGPYWGKIGQQADWETDRQGLRNFSISANSFGTGALVLALTGAGMLWRRNRAASRPPTTAAPEGFLDVEGRFFGWFFAAALVICYLLALGRHAPFYWFFYKLPYMGTWRNPLKFMVPGGLCLAVLAAYGTHAMINGWLPKRQRWLLIGGSIVTGLVVLVAWTASSWLPPTLTPHGYRPAEIAAAVAVTRQAATVAALVVGLVWLARAKPVLRMPLLACLVVGQMVWVHTHYLEPVNFRAAYRSNPLIDTLRSDPEPVRVKLLAKDGLLHYYLSAVFPYYRIASLDIPASSRMPQDYLAFFTALENNPIRLWQLAGVKYLALPAAGLNQLGQMPAVQQTITAVTLFRAGGTKLDDLTVTSTTDPRQATHALVTLTGYLPKATFVSGVETFTDQAALSQRLADPAWDPRRTLLLADPTATNPDHQDPATVALRRYTGNRIEATVAAASPGYLLINDRYDANWQATVAGRPVTPRRANLLLYAVPVPAGSSEVVLRYRGPATAIYLQLATLAVFGVAGAIRSVRRRKTG